MCKRKLLKLFNGIKITKDKISSTIRNSAEYILENAINKDGGIKWDKCESSSVSGVWTTAEALHFFLTSESYKAPPEKLKGMIQFILNSYIPENGGDIYPNGYWKMLNEDPEYSNTTTGYCVYVLDLSLSCTHLDILDDEIIKNDISRKIEGGKNWLKKNFILTDNGERGFWAENHMETDESSDELRKDHIFCTLHSCMGLNLSHDDNSKVKKYFRKQINHFSDKKDFEPADASTLCRLLYAAKSLKIDGIPQNQTIGLINRITTDAVKNYERAINLRISANDPTKTKQLHDFVLYDLGKSLFLLKNEKQAIERIVKSILDKLEKEYVYTLADDINHTIWPTIECLLILEKYIESISGDMPPKIDTNKIILIISIISGIVFLFIGLALLALCPDKISIIGTIITILSFVFDIITFLILKKNNNRNI